MASKIHSLTIDGVNVRSFKVKILYNSESAVQFYNTLCNEYLGVCLPSIGYGHTDNESHKNIEKEGEHYIVFDNTQLSYAKYSVEVANGNLYIRGSYASFPVAAKRFLELLEKPEADIVLTAENNIFDSIALPEIPYKNRDDLVKVINEIYESDRFLFGQHCAGTMNFADCVKDYADAVGREPSIMDMELKYIYAVNRGLWSKGICQAIEYCSRGGVLATMYHWGNPRYPDCHDYSGKLGSPEAWEDVVTKGTDLNVEWHKELDIGAEVFGAFDEAGVTIMFRPMFEGNGGWFWWCGKNITGKKVIDVAERFEDKGDADDPGMIDATPEQMIGLWKYVYNYYTNEKGYKNILWSYAPNVVNEWAPLPLTYYYPGPEYCDIVGFDWYTCGNYEIGTPENSWDHYRPLGKPIAFQEFGIPPYMHRDTREEQTKVFNCENYIEIWERMRSEGRKLAFAEVYSWKFGAPSWIGKGEVLTKYKPVIFLDEMPGIIKKILE